MGFLPFPLLDLPNVDAEHHSLKEQATGVWRLAPDLALLDRASKGPGKAQEVFASKK